MSFYFTKRMLFLTITLLYLSLNVLTSFTYSDIKQFIIRFFIGRLNRYLIVIINIRTFYGYS